MNFREFLREFERTGRLHEFRGEADPDMEIAEALVGLDGEPARFHRVKRGLLPVAGNLLGSRDAIALGLGCSAQDLLQHLAESRRSPSEPPLVEEGAFQEQELPEPDLANLPVLRHMRDDGGPYLTACVCIVRHPEKGLNAAFHRLMALGKDRATIRIVEDRHTDRAVKATSGDTPVAICIGAPVQAQVAAAMSPPQGVFEMHLADRLAKTPLALCPGTDLPVPAESEIVILGRITRDLDREGPFVDLTLTRDFVRQQPVVRVERIWHRADAIYQALLPGLSDHRTLMGMPREADIFLAVSRVCDCLDVYVTPGGCSWLHAVVQIRKAGAKDPQAAIEAAFEGHPSLKQCVVVDDDVNPRDGAMVEWAVSTRFQAATDLVVLKEQPSSSLDPSAEHPPGRKAIGSKLGVDATVKHANREAFDRVHYGSLTDDALNKLREG